jgi:regulator of RNase E activity RraA
MPAGGAGCCPRPTLRGIAGVVVDRACRDVDEARVLGLPIYGRSGVPHTARGRPAEVAMDEPVRIAGSSRRGDRGEGTGWSTG